MAEYRHIFHPEDVLDEEEQPQPSTNSMTTLMPPPPPPGSDQEASLNSFNSYPSQPVSTPPTSKAEWKQVSRGKQRAMPAGGRQNGQPARVEQKENHELNPGIAERLTPKARRPDMGIGEQNRIASQFHSNHVTGYLQAQNAKPQDGTWVSCPEIPTANELLDITEPWMQTEKRKDGKEDVVMDGNTLIGPWENSEKYLSAHWEMLREEAVNPLRTVIGWIKLHPHAPENEAMGGGIGIYTKVRFTTITFSTRGLGFRVVFSLSKVGKKIRWEQSKRLLSGSLVALTPSNDMFKTKCIVATVAARPMDLITEDPPKLDLFIARPEDINLDPTIEYTMIEERTSFFEAVRHVGVSLQKMASEKFPLGKHIVNVETKISPPKYILADPHFNLSSEFEPVADSDTKYDNVDVLTGFPVTNVKTTLDRSQREALSHIFKKCVALVQGPPGTGKTHVSVKALKLLTENMTDVDPPIVVACQTNHALDQLLRHVSEFVENFIRLGGRSKDTGIVKQRTLYAVRQKERFKAPGGMQQAARMALNRIETDMTEILAPLEYGKDQFTQGFMHLEYYRKAGILTQKQCDLLAEGDKEWAGPSSRENKVPLAQWLEGCLVHNSRTYAPDQLGGIEFEEADLEFEQLKEIEAENVCQDDENDFESLPGNGFPVFLAVSGKPSDIGDEHIERLLKNDNLWKVPRRHRGAVFNYMQRQAIMKMNKKVHELAARYNEAATRYRFGGFENNAILLRQQKIVGVTTTGLSKYRGLISGARPRIIMIEEAAETMEAPVTAGCVSSLEHLILVGDHKQLRPQCGVKMLEKEPFELNVSMFERLINNKLPYKMLKRQRRMIPEIRRLLGPIYHNDINDHPSMRNPEVRPPVPGMGGVNSFFFTNSWADSTDEQLSSTNLQEADMVVGFYDYLISNGLTEAQITVLTFYNGQRKLILRKLRNHPRLKRMANDPARIFKVLTVDSYQGEENDVVLLSLVRSNDMGKIGFLGVENRICVALSRAKRGFYMFGNAELLACESKLWAKVVNIMLADSSVIDADRHPGSEPHGRVVFRVPLRCTKHNERMYIETQEDWDKISGGCEKPCGEDLACGHPCHLNCHPFSHDKVICFEQCTKVLPCGHQCGRECYDQCRCKKCGVQLPQAPAVVVTRDENVSDDAASGSGQGSQGSNARAWQAFAKGGVRPHDAKLREVQRENYLEQQMKISMGEEAANDVKSPPMETDVTAITSGLQALTVVANGGLSTNTAPTINAVPAINQAASPAPYFASTEMFNSPAGFHVTPETTSYALPGRGIPDLLVDFGAYHSIAALPLPEPQPEPAVTPLPVAKPKLSHRNRFKKKEPSGSPIITTPPKITPQTTASVPPVGYTGAPSLTMPTLTPQRVVQTTMAPIGGYDGAMETVVLKSGQNGGNVAKKDTEDLLIDFD